MHALSRPSRQNEPGFRLCILLDRSLSPQRDASAILQVPVRHPQLHRASQGEGALNSSFHHLAPRRPDEKSAEIGRGFQRYPTVSGGLCIISSEAALPAVAFVGIPKQHMLARQTIEPPRPRAPGGPAHLKGCLGRGLIPEGKITPSASGVRMPVGSLTLLV